MKLHCWLPITGVLGFVALASVSLAVEDPPNGPDTSGQVPVAVLTEKLRVANISPPIQEIVKMSDAGMDAKVIQTFVENSTVAYSPRPDEIIYLHEHGISGPIITAMIERGSKLREQMPVQPVAAPQPVQPAPAQPAPTYVVQSPAPTIVTTPTYTYSSPSVIYIPYSGASYYGGCYSSCYSRPYYSGGYYSRPYFDFHYSSGWSTPYARIGFGFGGFRHHR